MCSPHAHGGVPASAQGYEKETPPGQRKKTLFDLMDTYIGDAKARKAYA